MGPMFIPVIAAILSSAHPAAPVVPTVSATAASRLRLEIIEPLAQRACATTVAAAWRDASDPRFFATGPTARIDSQESALFTLAPLISLRIAGDAEELLVLGATPRAGLHFTTSGWRPRWPLC